MNEEITKLSGSFMLFKIFAMLRCTALLHRNRAKDRTQTFCCTGSNMDTLQSSHSNAAHTSFCCKINAILAAPFDASSFTSDFADVIQLEYLLELRLELNVTFIRACKRLRQSLDTKLLLLPVINSKVIPVTYLF